MVYIIRFRPKKYVDLVMDFKKSVRTILPKAVNLRSAAETSVIMPSSQIQEKTSTKTGKTTLRFYPALRFIRHKIPVPSETG